MTTSLRDEGAEILRFGGGRNSRASEDRINPLECTDGENFILDPGNGEFRPRPAFDLVGTVPNASEIRGFVTLRETDGTVTMLVQAAGAVYKWDGAASFTSVGSVSSSAKLRGTAASFWALTDRVLIADLNQVEEVHEWDGTTFQQTSFFDEDGSTSFPGFRARYIVVDNERAYFGNIYESSQSFPHLLIASKRGDYTVVSASTRAAASGIGADAPWFLPVPQLKPINGMAKAFGVLAISQQAGDFEQLAGSDSTDFQLNKLYAVADTGAVGDESVVTIGNDIVYGKASHIESLLSTDKYGNVEFDDLSFKIADDITSVKDWTLCYNPRVRRLYCFPEGGNEVHVLHTDFIGTELSPWSKYTTESSFSFQPTAVMVCRDPADGLEYTFMGDANGNLYRMEGTGTSGDAGSANIIAYRQSIQYLSPLDSHAFDIEGWVTHRKQNANSCQLRFLFAGENVYDVRKTITLSAVSYDTPYNGSVYYGGSFYYGAAQQNRLVRRQFAIPGEANAFQVETKIEGTESFALAEVGFRYKYAST